MGIPRFYKFINDSFPQISDRISFKRGFKQQIDNLYLDANGIIHNCARECVENGLKGSHVFKSICQYISQLHKFVKPRRLLYIAIDGPAPVAKQIQQRQRRYKSSLEKTDAELQIFDSACITPGTEFMRDLSLYIEQYISETNWGETRVIFSPPDESGEGEHKIVEYIRGLKDKDTTSHCMYGLDADLFMLSLATQCPDFYLLREDQFHTVWNDTLFYKVNIGELRRCIVERWGCIGEDPVRLINDFIFICFMVGNDFLHAIPCCKDLPIAIDFMMQLKRDHLGISYITNDDNKGFNISNLLVLYRELAKTEEAQLGVQYYTQVFPNITLNKSLRDTRNPRLGVDINRYKELYYKKAKITDVNELCQHYIQGLEWVQHYYHKRLKNWMWYYPYHYTPFVSDIVRYLESGNASLKRMSTIKTDKLTAIQQLLHVIPPKSIALIPRELHDFYNKHIRDCYPDNCVIDLEGKTRSWEGVVLLPFVRLEIFKN